MLNELHTSNMNPARLNYSILALIPKNELDANCPIDFLSLIHNCLKIIAKVLAPRLS